MKTFDLLKLSLLILMAASLALGNAQLAELQLSSSFLYDAGNAKAYCTSGQYAYVVGTTMRIGTRLTVFDITNPNLWEALSSIHIDSQDPYWSERYRIQIWENSLYILNRKGIRIFDLSNPVQPVNTGYLPINQTLRDATVKDGHLLVMYGSSITSYSIADDGGLSIADSLQQDGLGGISFGDTKAIYEIPGRVFMLADIQNPADLQVLGQLNTSELHDYPMSIVGEILCASTLSRLSLWDISDLSSPYLIGIMGVGGNGNMIDRAVKGNYAAFGFDDGVYIEGVTMPFTYVIYNIEDPTAPELMHSAQYYGDCLFLMDSENEGMVISNGGSMQYVQLTPEFSMTPRMESFSNQQILANGDRVYVRVPQGVFNVDLSDPTNPVPGSLISMPSLVGMATQDDLLATASSISGSMNRDLTTKVLRIYSGASTGASLELEYEQAFPPTYLTLMDIQMSGDRLLTLMSNQQDLYDISNLNNVEHSLLIPGDPRCLSAVISDPYLYNGAKTMLSENLLRIFDLDSVVQPSLIAQIPSGIQLTKLRKHGNYLYGAEHSVAQVKIFNVANPYAPQQIHTINTTSHVEDIALVNNVLVVLTLGAIRMYDVRDPAQPVCLVQHLIDNLGKNLALSGNHIIVGGLLNVSVYDASHVYQVTSVSDSVQDLITPALTVSCSPNPFHDQLQIKVRMQESGLLKLELFNIRGQKIADMARDHYSAGEHSLNYQVEKLPAGVYLVKASAGGQSTVRKMLLIP